MTSPIPLSVQHVPARMADLGFLAQLPIGWTHHPLPEDELDFGDPSAFVPLAIVTAPHAAIVYAFAARPAHTDGSLHDWAWYHLQQASLQPRTMGRAVVAGVAAAVGEAVQASDLGPMVVRFAFLEDGDRLVQFSLSAPEMMADLMRDAWFVLLRSFTLESPRGSRFAVESHRDHEPAEPIPEPWLEPAPQPVAGAVSVRDEVTREPLLTSTALPDPLGTPGDERREVGDFALDADSLTLDDDHPVNRQLRVLAGGGVPTIAGLSDSQRRATLCSAAIQAEIDVPYGWHAWEDSHRLRVFEPGQRVSIEFTRVQRDSRSDAALLDAVEAARRQAHPQASYWREPVNGGLALAMQHPESNGHDSDELHLLHPGCDDAHVVHVQVSARPPQAAAARELVLRMLESWACPSRTDDAAEAPASEATGDAGIDAESTPIAASGPPPWWTRALQMEAAGDPSAAEAHIRDHVPYIGFACSIAEMYRLRMHRLQAAGQDAAAAEAYRKASDFIHFYASMATSGGEGAALSLERDDFLAQLNAEYRQPAQAQT